jgi:hypothetical protein
MSEQSIQPPTRYFQRARKLIAYWRFASATAHFSISILAIAAVANIVPLSANLLAVLIAWANLCQAIHTAAGPTTTETQ